MAYRIAWRSLWRHTQRTVLMIAIVAFGSWVILVLWGIVDGFTRSMTDTQIVYNQGDLQVRMDGYAADPTPSNGLTEETMRAMGRVLEASDVAAMAPRLEVFGLLRSAYGADGVVVRGVDPLAEQQVTRLQDAVVEGRFLAAAGEIVLPAALADALDIRLGERVVVLGQGDAGSRSRAFRAVGLFRIDLGSLDRVALVHLEDARALSGWEGLTAVALRLPRGASPTRTAAAIRESLATAGLHGVEVADFFALNPLGRLMLQGTAVKMIPFVLMISLLAGFGVANTAFYSVLERTREFGVMTALGMGRRRLAEVVLMESVFVSAIGFVVGGGLGFLSLAYLSRHGVDVSQAMSGFGTELGIPTVVYASTSGWYWLVAFSVVVCTALIAAWYPARRANQLEPVTAIREG